MARRKARTSITLPESLLANLDHKASAEGRTRSDLVCEAVSSYFAGEEERLLAEAYVEMTVESREASREGCRNWPQWWPEW